MNLESPEFVKLSLAAAMQLGYSPARFYRGAKMSCINLLLTYSSGCAGNCSYCGLARDREISEDQKSFIRVPWPVKPFDDVVNRIAANKAVKRVCISMITNRRSIADTVTMTEQLTSKTDKPVSILIAPTIVSREDLEAFHDAGCDKIGVAFDLPTEGLFDEHRGRQVKAPHKWGRYWKVFDQAVDVFGNGMVGSHFMVGLGETERQLVEAFQRVKDSKGVNHLFSFYPEKGSSLADLAQPAMDVYRRVQLACELVDSGSSSFDNFSFDETGKIIDFGCSREKLDALIDSGKPFQTRGCTGSDGRVACNRPFANSLPGDTIRNFPFELEPEDVQRVRDQLKG